MSALQGDVLYSKEDVTNDNTDSKMKGKEKLKQRLTIPAMIKKLSTACWDSQSETLGNNESSLFTYDTSSEEWIRY